VLFFNQNIIPTSTILLPELMQGDQPPTIVNRI
jgi:hypothetical protein